MANNPTISHIRVPNGTGATDYDIADLEARSGLATVSGNVNTLTTQVIPEIAGRVTGVEVAISGTGGTGGIYAELDAINKALVAGIRIIGATSTELHEGDTRDTLDPVSEGSLSKTTKFTTGDVVFYSHGTGGDRVIQEFVKTGPYDIEHPEKSGVWVLFGDSSIIGNSLGEFAYADSGRTSGFTPSGVISTGAAYMSGIKKTYKTALIRNHITGSAVADVVLAGSTGRFTGSGGLVDSFSPGEMPTFSVVTGPSSTNILQLTSGTQPSLGKTNIQFNFGVRLTPDTLDTGVEVISPSEVTGTGQSGITVIEDLGVATGGNVTFSGYVSGLTFSGNEISGLGVEPVGTV